MNDWIIQLLEEFSTEYKSDRKTVGTHTRTFLNRRWEVCKLIIQGITDKNYKKSMKLLDVLIDKCFSLKNKMDDRLIQRFAKDIQAYEKSKGW